MFPCLLPFFVISHHISNFLDIPWYSSTPDFPFPTVYHSGSNFPP
jgi:hypothetical protein